MVKGTYVDKNGVRKGAWTQEEDDKLRAYIQRYGHWNWRLLPKFAGLARCGKSCRLRWMNYLKPGVRRGGFSREESDLIEKLHHQHGNKWSAIAEKLPGRTDNAIKNYWHAHLKKRGTRSKPGEEAEISELRDGFSDSNVADSLSPILCSRKHMKSRVSSSDVLILESSDSESTSAMIPTDVELGTNLSLEQSCSETTSITSRVTQDADNFSDFLVSGFYECFWTRPFTVETDFYESYDFRVCDEEGVFSPLFSKGLIDANNML